MGSCEDEEPAASSPNNTLCRLSGKRAAATRSGKLEGDGTPRAGGIASTEEACAEETLTLPWNSIAASVPCRYRMERTRLGT
jgi:hypothetical protein